MNVQITTDATGGTVFTFDTVPNRNVFAEWIETNYSAMYAIPGATRGNPDVIVYMVPTDARIDAQTARVLASEFHRDLERAQPTSDAPNQIRFDTPTDAGAFITWLPNVAPTVSVRYSGNPPTVELFVNGTTPCDEPTTRGIFDAWAFGDPDNDGAPFTPGSGPIFGLNPENIIPELDTAMDRFRDAPTTPDVARENPSGRTRRISPITRNSRI